MKTNEEWRAILLKEQFRVLRQLATEAPFSGEYVKVPKDADKLIYKCVACGNPLYKASTQWNSGCGWPSFAEAIKGSIITNVDTSHGMVREEMKCSKCEGHLGHIFRGEGHKNPTNSDERHCVNSICLKLDNN